MIKVREAATVLMTAAVTMAIVVVLLWPMGMGAAEQPAALRVLQPTMTIGACRFTMEAAQLSTEPGATPLGDAQGGQHRANRRGGYGLGGGFRH